MENIDKLRSKTYLENFISLSLCFAGFVPSIPVILCQTLPTSWLAILRTTMLEFYGSSKSTDSDKNTVQPDDTGRERLSDADDGDAPLDLTSDRRDGEATKARQWMCLFPHCGKRFAKCSRLKVHETTHSDEVNSLNTATSIHMCTVHCTLPLTPQPHVNRTDVQYRSGSIFRIVWPFLILGRIWPHSIVDSIYSIQII